MTTYRPVRRERAVEVPDLDEHQRAVVDHPGGPLLVLAGPGTGKTTTLVEAIVDRIDRRGADPSSVLALTFSRKAAEQLRDRVTARLGRTVATPVAATFHSFAYQVVRQLAPHDLYEAPLRLLSTPEQDVVLQELLTDAPESVRWPDSLRRAVGTRGFSREVLDVLARAREKGLDAAALTALGQHEGHEEFAAAGHFLEQYLTVLDNLGAIDYPDLLRRAVIEASTHAAELRGRFAHVFVDEYQDSDPSQVQLLQSLVAPGGNLTVVGDPHQSIYGFRGADVRGILDFPSQFPTTDGSPAPVVVLQRTRRFGPHLLLAAQRIARRIPLAGAIPAQARDAFLAPHAEGAAGPGRVEVVTYATERAEAEHVADLLRRAHLEDGVAWGDMAVLVRSGRATIPGLRRSLAAAGVPVDVASDDTPLVREPAVEPLLSALRLVLHHDADPTSPDHVDAASVQELLGSPLAGLDVTDVRALARALRAHERVVAEQEGRSPRSSAELVRACVLDPSELPASASGPGVERARGFALLLERAREAVLRGDSAEEVLWILWSGSRWPEALRARSEGTGAAARLAHRDLDAVLALFEAAGRSEDQRGHRSIGSFLASLVAQQIPGDTLAEQGVRGECVRLLTAHRAKGLEWPLVVVAHVQEESWPDLRRRATLLRADRLGVDGLREPTTTREMLAEERRLFYVACTRARARLVVTAVASQDEDGEQPSRFVRELLPEGQAPRHEPARPTRPLSMAGLVADLRRAVCDPDTPAPVRRAAAVRLRRLGSLTDASGRAVAPGADPASWWGLRGLSRADQAVREEERPVALSASAVTELTECPARWFLQREAGGASVTSQAQGFGNVLHAIADGVASERLPASLADVDVLMAEVDRVWSQLSFRTPWSRARERDELRKALVRFLAWHSRPEARELRGSEVAFATTATLPDGEVVTLRGRADRLEVDAEGRVVVVDLKTGKYPPPDSSLAENPQLGFYQYAVAHGAFSDAVGPDARPGGAELWQVRKDKAGELKVQQQPPQLADEHGVTPIERQLMDAVAVIRGEAFEARPGGHCDRCQFQLMCPAQQSGTVLE